MCVIYIAIWLATSSINIEIDVRLSWKFLGTPFKLDGWLEMDNPSKNGWNWVVASKRWSIRSAVYFEGKDEGNFDDFPIESVVDSIN